MTEELRQDGYMQYFQVDGDWLRVNPALISHRKEMTGREAFLLMAIASGDATDAERLEFNYGLTKSILMRVQFSRMRKKLLPLVIERQGWNCAVCGSGEKLTVDHIVPLARGGTNDLSNLQLLCGKCNSSKGTK